MTVYHREKIKRDNLLVISDSCVYRQPQLSLLSRHGSENCRIKVPYFHEENSEILQWFKYNHNDGLKLWF